MDKQYMDYGNLIDKNTYTVPRNLTLIDYDKKGLVYHLTHDGEGKSLSFMNKAFISFTYGDKKIEDFGFIATTVNSRLDRENSPNSEDYTTEYKMLHGQYYWGSHYLARTMVITLATDGMTQKQLDDFKYWFQAGEIRELILSLHPNRAILARVLDRPEINVLPFKRLKRVFINNDWQDVEIIEYKGEAQINFVMDEPFWYAKHNVLGQIAEDQFGHSILIDKWIDSNGEVLSVLDNDGKKVVVLDKIPTASMINTKVNFSNTKFLPYNQYKYTITDECIGEAIDDNGEPLKGTPIVNDQNDILYPISGAIVGIMYKPSFDNLNNIITSISENLFRKGYKFDSDYKKIIETTAAISDDFLLYICVTSEYILVKAGSIIKLNDNKLNTEIFIVEYIKNNNNYERKNDNYLHILNKTNKQFIFTNDSYIRIQIKVLQKQWTLLDGLFLANKIILVSLISNLSDVSHLTLDKDNNLNYFYSGNAPSYPIVNFNIPIHFNQDGYIDSFSSKLLKHTNNKLYDSICLLSNVVHELKITNPSIFSSYNQVISKLKDNQLRDIPSFIQLLRNEIGHPGVRSWIINCINIYYNNFNMEAMTVTNEVKAKLLQYMPYFFASSEDIDILIYNDEPDAIKESFQSIASTKITRTDDLKERFQIRNKDILVTVPSGNLPDSSFSIKIQVYSDVEQKKLINDGLFYQWRYTTSEGRENNKWYLLYLDEQINEDDEHPIFKWEGVTSNLLKLNKVLRNDIGLYLQCVVSNNSFYQLSEEIHIIEFKDNLYISPQESTVTINQNSLGELIWNISGSFLSGEEEYTDADLYTPVVYYLPNGDENEDWVEYDKLINNYQRQILNGELTKQLTDNYDQYGNKITQYKFTFTAREDIGRSLTGTTSTTRFLYKLRDTKFKLIVYKRTAQSTIGPNDNDFEDFPVITILINRLDLTNTTVDLLITPPGGRDPEEIENITTWNQENGEGYLNGTKFDLSINNLLNLDLSSEGAMITLLKYNKESKKWELLNNNNKYSYSNMTFSWTLTDDLLTKDNLLRIYIKCYQEIRHLLLSCPLCLYILSQSDLDVELEQYKESKAYYTNISYNLYVNDTLTLLANHNNGIPTAVNNYKILTYWQYTNSVDENGNPINFLTLSLGLFQSDVCAFTDKLTFKYESRLEKQNSAIEDAGYYRCIYKLYLLKPSYIQGVTSELEHWDIRDISPSNYISVDVIEQMNVGNIICKIKINDEENWRTPTNDWTYYTEDETMDDESGTIIEKNQNNQSQNILIRFECPILNYDINNLYYDSEKLKYSYNWKIKLGNSNLFVNGTVQAVLLGTMIYNMVCTSAQNLYEILNNIQIYFTFVDKYTNVYSHDEEDFFNILFNTDTRHIVPITFTKHNLDTISWNWPLNEWKAPQTIRYNLNQLWYFTTSINCDTITNTIRYSILWENNTLSCIGTPQILSSETQYNDNTCNLHANSDKYVSTSGSYYNAGNIMGTTFLRKNYTGFALVNDEKYQYRTVLSFNPSDYSIINIKVNKTEISKYHSRIKHYYRIIQGNDVLIDETLLNLSTGIDLQWKLLDKKYNKNNNTANILIQFKIYYNGVWYYNNEPHIGANVRADTWPLNKILKDGITYTFNKSISYEYFASTLLYNPNNMPADNLQLVFDINGKEKRRTVSLMMGKNNFTTIIPKSFRMLKSNQSLLTQQYSNPIINKTYPILLNCQTGLYTMQVSYNTIKWPNGNLEDSKKGILKNDPKSICYLSSLRHGESLVITLSIGNAIILNNLIFSLQNHFDEKTYAVSLWTEEDKLLSYKVSYDGDIPLLNFNIDYKNLYL